MTDWKQYGPIYTIAPGIKKLGKLSIIEFDNEEERYLKLKKKSKENIYYDNLYDNKIDGKIVQKIKTSLSQEYPNIHLDVYSSFAIYGWPQRDDPYVELFTQSSCFFSFFMDSQRKNWNVIFCYSSTRTWYGKNYRK